MRVGGQLIEEVNRAGKVALVCTVEHVKLAVVVQKKSLIKQLRLLKGYDLDLTVRRAEGVLYIGS